ncbi:MAG: methyltransferase domain-containing protein [Promethearchaeota archaeon]
MAVVYMRKLEEQPATYDSNFTTLTKGVNLKVHEWVLDRVGKSESILELGCGTGLLATKLALKGNDVLALDKNFFMINQAMQNYPSNTEINLTYQIGTINNTPIEPESKNVIISTFMLSELRPLEQQILLRKAWKILKPNGRLILAAEFMPSGFWKIPFRIKRWWYKKKLKRLRLKQTFLLNWFHKYIEPIGFQVIEQKKWNHGAIQAMVLKKNDKDQPGYYFAHQKEFKGIKSQLRIYRCLFTGQVDRVPIEPGVYKSGNPTRNSPIIVTANYEYTYIKVMRDLKGIDAWVLCIDSNGINVWCAARGNDFGNNQLLEVVEATNIINMTDTRILLLPQLSAGGVAVPQLPIKSDTFPFSIKYGPVWSKHLPQFLREKPAKKSDKMKLAKFNISHRARGGITHTTFLFRKIFIYPIIGMFLLFTILGLIFNQRWFYKFFFIGEFSLWIIITNFIIIFLFPLSKFTRIFIYKGIFYGGINLFILLGLNWLIHYSFLNILWFSWFYFWIAFFSTMSLSGYTMSTSPNEIQTEYPTFSRINKILLILSIIFLVIGVIFY